VTRRHFKWIIVSALASVCAASWLALCVGLLVRFSLPIWTGIVTAAAISTEILFWAVAGALGVTVIHHCGDATRSRLGSGDRARREGRVLRGQHGHSLLMFDSVIVLCRGALWSHYSRVTLHQDPFRGRVSDYKA
jgi:hypothetical protein